MQPPVRTRALAFTTNSRHRTRLAPSSMTETSTGSLEQEIQQSPYFLGVHRSEESLHVPPCTHKGTCLHDEQSTSNKTGTIVHDRDEHRVTRDSVCPSSGTATCSSGARSMIQRPCKMYERDEVQKRTCRRQTRRDNSMAAINDRLAATQSTAPCARLTFAWDLSRVALASNESICICLATAFWDATHIALVA